MTKDTAIITDSADSIDSCEFDLISDWRYVNTLFLFLRVDKIQNKFKEGGTSLGNISLRTSKKCSFSEVNHPQTLNIIQCLWHHLSFFNLFFIRSYDAVLRQI